MQNGFDDSSFDVIISNNALHHVVDDRLISRNPVARQGYIRMFAELRRLLVPGGFLSVYEFSRSSFWRWSPYKWKYKQIDWELHPTCGEWLLVIREAGFRTLSCEYAVPYPLRRFEKLLSNSFVQFFLYSGFVITAQA